MKTLVLGAGGMAGHVIAIYFKEQGHDVTGFATRPVPWVDTIEGDASDAASFTKMLRNGEWDVVINCIGLLNATAEERPSQAVYLNSYLPHLAADTLRGLPTKFIHMSTDCVFAGNTGPYRENSMPDGRTFYDRTKALGEVDDDKNLTFRNSIIGPDVKEAGIGLFNWFMKQGGGGGYTPIKGFTGAIWTGVTTITLARAMECAVAEGLSGVYNLVNGSSISKFELLCLFNKYFRDGGLPIEPSDAVRLDKTLVCTRSEDFSFEVPSYEQMVAEMRQWIDEHRDIYPKYY